MIDYQDVTFTYPGAAKPAIRNVNLQIPEEEFVLVVGRSGAGKSTFLRCLNGLVPHFSGGAFSGRVRVGDLDPVEASPMGMSRHVGFVFQDPENQFVMDTVEDDIAFTLENAGVPPDEIQERVENSLAQLGIRALRGRKLQTLSGGEQQKVALASAIVLSPRILVLDEPTSQLDPHAARDILETIVRLKHQLRLTVFLSEHRLERVLQYADRLIYFDGASDAVLNGPPDQVLPRMSFQPPVVSIGLQLGWKPLPLSVEQARPFASGWLHARSAGSQTDRAPATTDSEYPANSPGKPILQIHGLSVQLGQKRVLEEVDLELFESEILALMGPNGAGKTTLLRAIMGLKKPTAGNLTLSQREIASFHTADLCRRVGYIPQDPNSLLFADKVYDELLITLRNHHLPVDEAWLEALLDQLGILSEADRYPRDLSVGQRQRVALGAILVTKPGVILMDEPTRGMDALAKDELVALLSGWRTEGRSILLVTHDVELVATCADRIAVLEEGRIEKTGSPRQILPGLGDLAPQAAQLFPGKGWLTTKDVLHSDMALRRFET